MSVESAEGPVEAGYVDRHAEARADGVLGDAARKVGRANASGKSQPWEWFEFVIHEEGFEVGGGVLAIGER